MILRRNVLTAVRYFKESGVLDRFGNPLHANLVVRLLNIEVSIQPAIPFYYLPDAFENDGIIVICSLC